MLDIKNLNDVMNYVEENQEPKITEVAGQQFSNKKLYPVVKQEADCLHVRTLDAIVQYVKADEAEESKYVITIDGVRDVSLRSVLDTKTRQREKLVHASAEDYSPDFGYFLNLETFLIALRSRFVPTDHSVLVLQALGNVKRDEGVNVEDDGISQQITAKKGVSYENETLPNPVVLKPFRTFPEIEQPESEFVLRLNNNIEARLDEADGGVWRVIAIQRIYEYLAAELATEIEAGEVIILG
ncbi:hypothetical protein [Culicoidibacter larvae]|uniref:Uncharacterized protein n=1 Tax=Culicoidibacter larvae TaxID=2579976 RepID=A0A5R8Q981_9FIRM|nr:hypothetical protein [Culicoidibacter larvae]TLG71399.1 hypothetical protein FEZ08_10925 [Culicoidibacter larvae]